MNKKLVYFDNAATSLIKPKEVIEEVDFAVKNLTANPGRSGHIASQFVAGKIYQTREKVKDFFGVKRFTRINAKKEGGHVYYSTIISTGKDITADDIYNALSQNDFIISITREDDEF